MSSATGIFILKEALGDKVHGRYLLAAFRPGFSAYFIVWISDHRFEGDNLRALEVKGKGTTFVFVFARSPARAILRSIILATVVSRAPRQAAYPFPNRIPVFCATDIPVDADQLIRCFPL